MLAICQNIAKDDCMSVEQQPSLLAIHTSFAGTEFGKTLAERIRYEKYRPEGVTNDRWRELLGADVNNLSHLTLTYGLTRSFVRRLGTSQAELLSPHEETVLQTAALIHDWAEAIVGDVSFGDKTTDDDAVERASFEANLAKFYSGNATELIDEARKDVIFDHASKLGKMFNAVERVGYLRTALRASVYLETGTAPGFENSFLWITADVLSNQIPALVTHAADYGPVSEYLAHQEHLISNAFDQVNDCPSVFENYRETQLTKLAQFDQAEAVWQNYLLPG